MREKTKHERNIWEIVSKMMMMMMMMMMVMMIKNVFVCEWAKDNDGEIAREGEIPRT